MQGLRDILWTSSVNDPIEELGNAHWLFLLNAWFSALDECKIRPLLEAGRTVVIDSWYYKYLARYRVKPGFPQALVDACFHGLRTPDIVVYLGVDPATAIARKGELNACESGAMQAGAPSRTEAGFISYQRLVATAFEQMRDSRWLLVETNTASLQEVCAVVRQGLRARLASTRIEVVEQLGPSDAGVQP